MSIDSLVKETADTASSSSTIGTETSASENNITQPHSSQIGNTQRILGFILLGVGLLGLLLALPFGVAISFISLYLILCGIICLIVKKNAGLVIGWLTLLPCIILMPYMTGCSLAMVFNPYFFQLAVKYPYNINLIISFVMWIFTIILVCATVRKTPLRGHAFLILGWIVFSQLRGYLRIALGLAPYNGTFYLVMGWLTVLLLFALLFFTARLVWRWRKRTHQPN